MTKPSSTTSIEHATGKPWGEWVAFLDEKGGRSLGHGDIAKLAQSSLAIESAAWWAQAIAVAYEQHIGRRAAGQRSDGTFEISATKTFPKNREEVFTQVTKALETLPDINGHAKLNPRTSITPMRSYWRCELDDGSKISVAVEERAPEKALLVITQSNISLEKTAQNAKNYWQQFLADLDIK